MFIPITRRLSAVYRVGIYNNFPADYTKEHKDKLLEQYLDEYEFAFKRHFYIELPRGISMEDFWNNQ